MITQKRFINKRQVHRHSDGAGEKIRVCSLGGLGEVGRNLSFIEYKNQILILDCGLRFPEEDMPGIDFIIPNIEYLEKNKKKIVGVFISHGHFDHIGAIPYIINKLGNPPIYTAPLTRGIILRRQDDFPNQPKLKIEVIDPTKLESINLGHFKIHPFRVNHNIPDSLCFSIETEIGSVFYMTDFKFDYSPIIDPPVDLGRISKLASRGVLLLMADSTGAEEPGHSISEKNIYEDLESIFEKSQGKIIAATFSSLVSRVQQLVWLSEKYGRRVVIDGFSMKNVVAIARALGYLQVGKNTIISAQEAEALHRNQITIICTGSQGEDRAVLMRMVNREHKYFKIERGDSVIFSSSVVPGNERAVQNLKDNFYRQGARVFHYKMLDIHAGGHAQQDDLKLMHNLIKPKFFMPVHGQYSMLQIHADLAEQLGMPKSNIAIADNGRILELSKNTMKFDGEVPASYVMVDGLGVGDVGEVVLRDRTQLAQDGMVVIVAMIDGESGQLKGEAEIHSRGFVYLKESKEFIKEINNLAKDIISKTSSKDRTTNWAYVKDNLRDKIGEFIFKRTERRPMILPFIVEI